jgi:hypothetical protein
MKYHDSTPDCHNFQHPIPQPHQPSISACLIVKDEAATLDRCLASIAPVVDEIIVVDTGSTDSSVEIARRYTDKVFFYPWHDDFAAARNESLRHATGDWVMVIDADEWLEPEIYPCLREYIRIVQTKRKQVHSLPILNAKICYPDQPALFKRTLFPNHSSLYFAGRVHEVLASELPLQNYLCHELKLQHGLIEIEKSISKQAYYHHLLVQSINEAPTAELQLHALKHLGDSYWSQGQKHFAQKLYHKYLSTLKALNLWNSSDWFITQVEQRLLTLRSKAGKLAPQLGFIASLGILTACQAAIPGNITHPNMAQRSIHSQGSQPNLEHLRKKYGPHVMIGVENPVYQKYIADKQSWPISQLQTFMATPQFQTKSIFNDNYPVGENGCPSPFAAVRTCIPQVYTGQWDQVTQCYQSGGVPIYSAQETCTRLEACPTNYYSYSTGPYGFSNYPAGYFHPRSHVESVICEGGNNNSDPDDGSEGGNEDGGGGDSGEGSGSGNIGSGCAPGKVKVKGKCVPEDEPLLYLDVAAAYFSPNGDGEQDSLSIQVKTNGDGAVVPWQIEVLHQGSSVWQTTGMGNQSLSWDGSGQSDGKVQLVLREQGKNKVHDRKNSAIDITPPEIEELNLSQNKDGKRQVKVRLKDPAVNGVRSGVIPDSVEVEMASDRFSLVSSQTDDKGPNAVLAMTLQENDFGIASFRIQDVNGNGYTLRAKDAAGNRVQKTLEECVASGELKRMRQQLAKTSQELQKLRDDIGEPIQLSSLPGGQGFGVAHVSGMPSNHAGGFSILAVPLCDNNEPCTLFDRAEYVDRYGPGILTDHDRLRYNDLQKQIEFDNEKIEIYAGFALKTSAEMAVTFLTPMGAEVGVAYQVMAFSNYLKSAAPAVQAAIIARHHRALYAALGAYTAFLNKLTQGLNELMASSAKGQFCAAGGPPLNPGNAKNAAHFMELHSDNLAKNTGRSLQDAEVHIIGYRNGKLKVPNQNQMPAFYYAKNAEGVQNGQLELRLKHHDHEVESGVELAKRKWDVLLSRGTQEAPDVQMRPYGSGGEFWNWNMKRLNPLKKDPLWPADANLQKSFDRNLASHITQSKGMYPKWFEQNSHLNPNALANQPRLLVDVRNQPNIGPQQITQMVANFLSNTGRKPLLESHQEYLFLFEARTIHVKKQGTGFNIREVQNLAEVMP